MNEAEKKISRKRNVGREKKNFLIPYFFAKFFFKIFS
jgi:hypothetical protein